MAARLFGFAIVFAALLPLDGKPDEPAESARPVTPLTRGQTAGQVRKDNSLKMDFAWCPPGKFTMGSPPTELNAAGRHSDDENQVEVVITSGFWLGKYEVTQAEYETIMERNPSAFSRRGKYRDMVDFLDTDDFPVEKVSYDDCVRFCVKLTDQERAAGRLPGGCEYCLPTEAQWEYACRAGSTTAFSNGAVLTLKDANCSSENPADSDKRESRTVAIGSYKDNAWGFGDMHGTVFEWCRDGYTRDLPGGADPEVTKATETRVIRGGAWNFYPAACRPAQRYSTTPASQLDNTGFRVALVRTRVLPDK